jgi:hypothetical protein
VLWSAFTPRSIKSQDLDCGRRFINEDLVLDLHRFEAPLAAPELAATNAFFSKIYWHHVFAWQWRTGGRPPAHHVSSDKGGWAPALFLHQVTLQDRHIRRVGHKHNREIAERQTGGEMGFGNRSAVRGRDDRRKRNIMGRRR